jgi:hypothetical protein
MSRNSTSSQDSIEDHGDYQNSESENSASSQDVSGVDSQDSETDEGYSQSDDHNADSLGISLKSYELLTEYRKIAGINQDHSDASSIQSYDSQNNDCCYNDREDQDEIDHDLVIFFFRNRNEDGMDGMVEYLRREDEGFDYSNDLRFLLGKASELEIAEIIEHLDEEITDEDLDSLDSDYLESLRDGNCSRIRNLWKVRDFCQLMGTENYFYDPSDLEDYLEEEDFAKIVRKYLSHIKDFTTKDSGLAKDLINLIEHFEVFCTEIDILNIFYTLTQRVAEKYDYWDDLSTIVKNYYLIEIPPKRVILELQKLLNTLLSCPHFQPHPKVDNFAKKSQSFQL